MTTLAKISGVRPGAVTGRHVTSPPDRVRELIVRLQEESGRQVPFSQVKLLLRQAAAVIERLEADVAAMTTGVPEERAGRRGP